MEHKFIVINSRGSLVNLLDSKQWLKQGLITQAMMSANGRVALAAAMMAPIRQNLNYQSISRQCLSIQPLPSTLFIDKAYRHDEIIATSKGKIGRKNVVRRINLIYQLIQNSINDIMQQEDEEILKIFDSLSNVEWIQ